MMGLRAGVRSPIHLCDMGWKEKRKERKDAARERFRCAMQDEINEYLRIEDMTQIAAKTRLAVLMRVEKLLKIYE